MKFISPTDGSISFNQTYQTIMRFVREYPDNAYKLIIGTDSQPGSEEASFVTAIVIYRIGRGGRFFYHRDTAPDRAGFKQRIFYEVSRSLEVASKLTGMLAEEEELNEELEIEIHVDVGEKGPTSTIIKEVVGMVVGSGYDALIKPEAYAASSVADKFTR